MRKFKLDWKNIAIGAVGAVTLCVVPFIGDSVSNFIVSVRKKIGGN